MNKTFYTPSNTPAGRFEEYNFNTRKWEIVPLEYIARMLKDTFNNGAAEEYDNLIHSGLMGSANGCRTRNPIRFEPR